VYMVKVGTLPIVGRGPISVETLGEFGDFYSLS